MVSLSKNGHKGENLLFFIEKNEVDDFNIKRYRSVTEVIWDVKKCQNGQRIKYFLLLFYGNSAMAGC